MHSPQAIIHHHVLVLYNGHMLTTIDGTDETLDIHNTQYAMWVKASIRNTQYANPVKPHCVIRKMLPQYAIAQYAAYGVPHISPSRASNAGRASNGVDANQLANVSVDAS